MLPEEMLDHQLEREMSEMGCFFYLGGRSCLFFCFACQEEDNEEREEV